MERGMKGGGSDPGSECLHGSRPISGEVVQGLGKDKSLAKVCFTRHFVPIDPWEQAVQPTIQETKNGNWEGLCQALAQITKECL